MPHPRRNEKNLEERTCARFFCRHLVLLLRRNRVFLGYLCEGSDLQRRYVILLHTIDQDDGFISSYVTHVQLPQDGRNLYRQQYQYIKRVVILNIDANTRR
jgi:hypothetical protein